MSISQLFLSDAFFQAHPVDGHGYLDGRGSLVRTFTDQFENWRELDEDGSTPPFQTRGDPGPAARIGRAYRIKRGDLDQWWANRQPGASLLDAPSLTADLEESG